MPDTARLSGEHGESPAPLPTMRQWLRPLWAPVAHRAAQAIIAGDTVSAALAEARLLQANGFASTVGFWNGPEHTSLDVAAEYLCALQMLRDAGLDCQLSLKPLALAFRRDLLAKVVSRARDFNVQLQFDSPAAEVADIMLSAIQETACEGADIGCTIPGRWRRSLTDANWAIEHGLAIRVVKGQWADPDDPLRDPAQGFLSVIDHVAGRARRVSVATHDPVLAREAISRLRGSRTPCELELLVGYSAKRSLRLAREIKVPVRGYIAYGYGCLMYGVRQAVKNPRVLMRLSKDLAGRSRREWTSTVS